MRSIYDIPDHVEKRPAMYLGNDYGVIALNHFITGFITGGVHFYYKKSNYPDFLLFTDWLGGMLKFKHEKSSMNWSWLLLDKYKDDKKGLERFFFYLKQFKTFENEVIIVPLLNVNIQYAIDNKEDHLWCKVGNDSKSYYSNLKKESVCKIFIKSRAAVTGIRNTNATPDTKPCR